MPCPFLLGIGAWRGPGRVQRSASPYTLPGEPTIPAPFPGPSHLEPRHVPDLVRVPLLREEELSVVREVLLTAVAAHDRVEHRRPLVGFGPQDTPEALRLLLPTAERTRDLDRDVGVGQVHREVAHLAHRQQLEVALAE